MKNLTNQPEFVKLKVLDSHKRALRVYECRRCDGFAFFNLVNKIHASEWPKGYGSIGLYIEENLTLELYIFEKHFNLICEMLDLRFSIVSNSLNSENYDSCNQIN